MTLRDIRLDRQTFIRHFEKEPKTISMHPQDFSELVNDNVPPYALYAKPDGIVEIMGMALIKDQQMPIGEIVLQ